MRAPLPEWSLVMDTHVHLYRDTDQADTLRQARVRLLRWAERWNLPRPLPVLCLAERHDHNVFVELKNGRLPLGPEFTIEVPQEPGAVLIFARNESAPTVVLAGRQIVTSEKVEVLGLIMENLVQDGRPLLDTLERIRAEGGLPVLSWAPGKWWGQRGRLARGAIAAAEPGALLLGDSSLRPWLWPEPRLFRKGREQGLTVVAGSDPLPIPGDAAWAGQVATVYHPAAVDLERPASSIAVILGGERPKHPRIGRHLSPATVLLRLLKNYGHKAAKAPA